MDPDSRVTKTHCETGSPPPMDKHLDARATTCRRCSVSPKECRSPMIAGWKCLTLASESAMAVLADVKQRQHCRDTTALVVMKGRPTYVVQSPENIIRGLQRQGECDR